MGILEERAKGWRKEVNLISWNFRKPKIDIRDLGEEHENMGKGIILLKDKLIALKEILNLIDVEDLDI